MWHLYSRHDCCRGQSTQEASLTQRTRFARRALWQPLPLHRLHSDLRGGAASIPRHCHLWRQSMRSFLPRYEMKTPHDLGEALELMARSPADWKPLAGGTDLMVLLEQ